MDPPMVKMFCCVLQTTVSVWWQRVPSASSVVVQTASPQRSVVTMSAVQVSKRSLISPAIMMHNVKASSAKSAVVVSPALRGGGAKSMTRAVFGCVRGLSSSTMGFGTAIS